MHPLVETFEVGRARLVANPASAILANPAVSVEAKLTVVPTMAFWVLGFGDAMALLRRTSGSGALDRLVEQHAQEDAEHWRWFVADLESLASEGIGSRSMSDALLRQWGQATAPVRECAWTVHHLLRTHPDALSRLIVLEVCEHGFEAFMDSMRPVVQEAGYYERLRFFGAIHDAAEASHTLHETSDPLESVDWSGLDVEALRHLAETVYDCLDGMHGCYAQEIAAAHRGEQEA